MSNTRQNQETMLTKYADPLRKLPQWQNGKITDDQLRDAFKAGLDNDEERGWLSGAIGNLAVNGRVKPEAFIVVYDADYGKYMAAVARDIVRFADEVGYKGQLMWSKHLGRKLVTLAMKKHTTVDTDDPVAFLAGMAEHNPANSALARWSKVRERDEEDDDEVTTEPSLEDLQKQLENLKAARSKAVAEDNEDEANRIKVEMDDIKAKIAAFTGTTTGSPAGGTTVGTTTTTNDSVTVLKAEIEASKVTEAVKKALIKRLDKGEAPEKVRSDFERMNKKK